MDNFALNVVNLIENNFEFNEKYVNTRDTNIQDWYIKNAVTEEYNEEFVTEMFNKFKKTFQTKKTPGYSKSSYNYKMNDLKITLKLEYNYVGYWFCKIDNIKLKYNTATIESLNNDLYSNNINIKTIEQSSLNKMIFIDNDKKFYTNYYVVSYNLVYPVSYEELGKPLYKPFFLNNCLSSFIHSCKSDLEVMSNIELKNKFMDLDEIFYINPYYEQSIKDKIIHFRDLYKLKKNDIDQFNEKLKDEKLKYSEGCILEENLNVAKSEMYNYFKDFFKINNNWKIFIYVFIKDSPISF
jgi:hypothetical protein